MMHSLVHKMAATIKKLMKSIHRIEIVISMTYEKYFE